MTMPMDPFQAGDQSESAANPQSAAAEWTQALNDPKVRSSLLSFGLQLMQPPGFGQTISGQIAQGIGSAGETLGRQDEEDLKQREQARKEMDTRSLVDYRSDTADQRAVTAGAAETRANAAVMNANSLSAVRQAQVQMYEAKVPLIQSQVAALETKTALYPQDQATKIELARARTALAEAQAGLQNARAGAIPDLTASQVNKNNASADLSRTRADLAGRNTDINERRTKVLEGKAGLQTTLDRQRGDRQLMGTYQRMKAESDKARFLDKSIPPFPDFQTWKEQNGFGGRPSDTPPATPPTATTPAPSPAPVAATPAAQPDSQLPPAPTDPKQRPPGRYMTPKGPLTWTGTGWVP